MSRRPREGDIRRIYGETIDALYDAVARHCHGDRALAEDIVQETWFRAVRAWRTDGIPDRPAAWLARVALRLLSNYRRHERVEGKSDEDPDIIAADAAPQASAARRSLVQRALDRLPRLQARLLEAFHLDGRRVAEIAATSGLSERAVEGRLRRARLALKRSIESESDGEDI